MKNYALLLTIIPMVFCSSAFAQGGFESTAACRPSDPTCNDNPPIEDDDDEPCVGPAWVCNNGGNRPPPPTYDPRRFATPVPSAGPIVPWTPPPNPPDSQEMRRIMESRVEEMSLYQLNNLRRDISSFLSRYAGQMSTFDRQALYDKLSSVETEIRILERMPPPPPPPGPPPPPPPPLW